MTQTIEPHRQRETEFQHLRINNLIFQKQEVDANIPCLTLHSTKSITKTVQCGDMVVKAVVDTGAAVTTISP